MEILFSGFFFAYLLYSLFSNWRNEDECGQKKASLATVVLQAPLFVVACYFASRQGAFSRDLVSPLHISIGLVAGHALFGISLLATHQEFRDAAGHFLEMRPLWDFLVENPNLLFRFFAVSLTEEIIYRAAAQGLLIAATGHVLAPIIAVALAFSVVHWHFFRNPVVQSGEFAVFSVLLGGLYYLTGSLILVVVIHTVRNLEIVYLEYLIQLEDSGDAEAAQSAIEKRYGRRSVEQL